MISTKGRYALSIMLDLAQHGGEENFISLKDISERQEISMKYLEAII
ncbi:MAG: Rrf2 family transcriptional regulator, partial [Eubacterium sp.]|nr:Rrf2 family transcriptional regulator [Eubacterium sp.]